VPELAVTVALYVPVCVPGVVCPPYDTNNVTAPNKTGAASADSRLRRSASRDDNTEKMNIDHIGPRGQTTGDTTLAVADPIVSTLTVAVWVVLPLICTDGLERLHVGAKVSLEAGSISL